MEKTRRRKKPTIIKITKREATIGNPAVAINFRLCTGCRLCEIACSLVKTGTIYPATSRIRVYQFDPGPIDVPVVCSQCSDHPCLAACPPKISAISLDALTGAIKIDEAKCVGIKCSHCQKACPQEVAITFHPTTKKALVCDLCGGDPECVKVCPTGALSFVGGGIVNGTHLAKPPRSIAESLALQFYPAKKL